MFNIVLWEPEIPPNTGNVARTCAVTGSKLHLIEPLGFSLDEKNLKRAGLDYWNNLDITIYANYEEFLSTFNGNNIYFTSTKCTRPYTEIAYQPGDFLVFGPETRGIPEDILKKYANQCIKIPMRPGLRSLNLSNSVAIVVYEAWRQNSFNGSV